jgi:hypothetical protein
MKIARAQVTRNPNKLQPIADVIIELPPEIKQNLLKSGSNKTDHLVTEIHIFTNKLENGEKVS